MTRSSAILRAIGVSVKQYTEKYEKAFIEDTTTLNIETPSSGAGD